jgi:uncharacterized membrane protein
MRGEAGRLDRAIEIALTLGLLASGALLVLGLAWSRPDALRAGIVMLMFTPVARVAIVTAGLALEHDWVFAAVSLWVLAVLLSSLHVAHFW